MTERGVPCRSIWATPDVASLTPSWLLCFPSWLAAMHEHVCFGYVLAWCPDIHWGHFFPCQGWQKQLITKLEACWTFLLSWSNLQGVKRDSPINQENLLQIHRMPSVPAASVSVSHLATACFFVLDIKGYTELWKRLATSKIANRINMRKTLASGSYMMIR